MGTRSKAERKNSMKLLITGLVVFVFTITGAIFLVGHKAYALSNVSPDNSEFGNAPTSYPHFILADGASDLQSATSMGLELYRPGTKPTTTVPVAVTYEGGSGSCDGLNAQGFSGLKVGSPETQSSSFRPGTLYLPSSVWTEDGNGYTASIVVSIQDASTTTMDRGDSNCAKDASYGIKDGQHVNFSLSAPSGYYMGPDTHKFAVAQDTRKICYPSHGFPDGEACQNTGDHINYLIPFAPNCNQSLPHDPSNPQSVILYDMDNETTTGSDPIQYPAMQIYIYKGSSPNSADFVNDNHLSSGSEDSSHNAYFGFNYAAKTNYLLEIHQISINNVLQVQLPFPSVNTQIQCEWSASATTKIYNDSSTGLCGTDKVGSSISNGATISVDGTDAKKVCLNNVVKSSSTSNEDGSLKYVIRYATYYKGAWSPSGADPPSTSACSWPNTHGTDVLMASASTYSASTCNPASYVSSVLSPNSSITSYDYNYVTIPGSTPTGTKFCEWVYYTPTNSLGGVNGNSTPQCFTVKLTLPSGNGMSPTCDQVTASIPSVVEPSTSFTASAELDYNQTDLSADFGASPGLRVYMKLSGIDTTEYMTSDSSPPLGGVLSVSHTYGPAGVTIGTYTMDYGLTAYGSNLAVPCGQKTFQVAYKPYFNVIGGDVTAGTGFGENCTEDTNAGVESWNNDNTTQNPNYTGGGSQLATFALGDITQFVTGSYFSGDTGAISAVGVSKSPSELAFSNQGTALDSSLYTYGGKFGGTGSLPCEPDYITAADSSSAVQLVTPDSHGFIPASDYTSNGIYEVTGDLTVPALILPNTAHPVISVSGSVYLTGNIIPDSYSGASEIPSFTIYATGYIYIESNAGNPLASTNVTELHGDFVAEGANGNGGTFATCATGADVTNVSETTKYNICNTPLKIYGSVAAQNIDFDRTFGSLNAGHGPAESIIYTPELWAQGAAGPICTADDITGCPYASVTSLPPVL